MTREYVPFSATGLRFIRDAGPSGDEPGVRFAVGEYDIDISVTEIREMIDVVEEGTEDVFVVRP